MCSCTTCSSADLIPKYICVDCHTKKMQEAFQMIEGLQRELRTIRTQYSFAKAALDYKMEAV
jgi:hypothetical protein